MADRKQCDKTEPHIQHGWREEISTPAESRTAYHICRGVPNNVHMNRLAQYAYEEINKWDSLTLSLHSMSAKPDLVAALTRAIERATEDAMADFQKSMDAVREQWASAGKAIADSMAEVMRVVEENKK